MTNDLLRARLAQIADEIDVHITSNEAAQRLELIAALKERADDLAAFAADALDYSLDGVRDYVLGAGVDLINIAYGRAVV